MKKLILLFTGFCCLSVLNGQDMENAQLERIIEIISDTVRGQNGRWEFFVEGVPMICITDEYNNRMRIISAVKEEKDVTSEEIKAILQANFHSALDVRYAIAEDILWVAYIHPLGELTKEQIVNAMSQVYNAYVTFGTTYSSTELVFPKQPTPEELEKIEESTH